MDIDDEFADFMRHVHADVPEDHPQYAISRNVFFGGMMAMYGIINSPNRKQAARDLVDVQKQLKRHMERGMAGMEPGFSNTNFGE